MGFGSDGGCWPATEAFTCVAGVNAVCGLRSILKLLGDACFNLLRASLFFRPSLFGAV